MTSDLRFGLAVAVVRSRLRCGRTEGRRDEVRKCRRPIGGLVQRPSLPRVLGTLAAIGAGLFEPSPANAETIATLDALGPALRACWHPTPDSAGSQITVLFSLDRTGAVIGKPRITFSKLLGTATAQRDFVAAALGALAACTPVGVSPGLGGAIAGRPLSIRFIGGPNGTAL